MFVCINNVTCFYGVVVCRLVNLVPVFSGYVCFNVYLSGALVEIVFNVSLLYPWHLGRV